MSTSEEREKTDILINEVIAMCSSGDKNAAGYLYAINYCVRVFDDLLDKDSPVSDEQLYKTFFILSSELWLNPFFLQHAGKLIPLHIASFNALRDSDIWGKSDDVLKKTYAHVMRDFSNELLGFVAFLTGGYLHMQKSSMKIKELFIKDIENKGVDK